jgi:uncharacterized protein
MTLPTRGRICVFAKPPVPGIAKTRLAAELGDARTAALAKAFLRDTWSLASATAGTKAVLATTDGTPEDFGLPGCPEIWRQGGGDLGERIERIVRRGLTEAEFVIAIGGDTPGLPPRLLEEARRELEHHDAVLGPSDDGGFYLIGLSRCPARLFQHLPWSSPRTFAATKERLESAGMSVGVLDRWFDVDVPEDLDRLRQALARGELRAPETSKLLVPQSQEALKVSVIVPVLNEEPCIRQQMEALRSVRDLHEIIVVDGGSTDETTRIVREFDGVHLVTSRRGRATQMNKGAEIATGEVLLFLHADVRLPGDAVHWVRDALASQGVIAGAFRTWTVPDRRTWLAPLLHLADVRSRTTGLPYGDQALFVRAEAFRSIGGFPDLPLMEDLELSRRLTRIGRLRTVRASVRVSGRRFVARPVYYTFLVNVFPLLYRLGIPPRALASLYGNPR